LALSGSPITPVEARKMSGQPAADRAGGDLGGELAGVPAGLAGERVWHCRN